MICIGEDEAWAGRNIISLETYPIDYGEIVKLRDKNNLRVLGCAICIEKTRFHVLRDFVMDNISCYGL